MMYYRIIILFIFHLFVSSVVGYNRIVVADSISRQPLSSASLFDRNGRVIGVSDKNGQLPEISPSDLPITIRFLSYQEKVISELGSDTILMSKKYAALPEVVVESKRHKVLHVVACVREYSTLSTYTDTVFLFREKMVDFMLDPSKKSKFKGWSSPRVIKSNSYYRFTDDNGLDSVSNMCSHHFSWSDWIGILPPPALPEKIKSTEIGADTLMGKYSPTEIWNRHTDNILIDVNVLADTTSRKWVPNLSSFFRNNLDFENFRLKYRYANVLNDTIYPTDLVGYSFIIESNGRGHDMFRFNRLNQNYFVSTFAEVYIVDKKYITIKEARQWEKRKFGSEGIDIIESADVPELQASIKDLINRVNNFDYTQARLALKPDQRLVGRKLGRKTNKQNLGQRALGLLKQLSGITYYKSHRNMNNQWNSFNKDQSQKNRTDTEQ